MIFYLLLSGCTWGLLLRRYAYLVHSSSEGYMRSAFHLAFLPMIGFYQEFSDFLIPGAFWILDIILAAIVLPFCLLSFIAIICAAALYIIWSFLIDVFRKR